MLSCWDEWDLLLKFAQNQAGGPIMHEFPAYSANSTR